MWKMRRFQKVVHYYERLFSNNIQKMIEEKKKYLSDILKEIKEIHFCINYNQLKLESLRMLYKHKKESSYEKENILQSVKKQVGLRIIEYRISKCEKKDQLLRQYRERLRKVNSDLTYHHLM